MRCVIIGFIKCGQNSLKQKLRDEGHEVAQFECVTNPLGPRMIKKNFPDCKVYIITRDPIKRIWSQYNFMTEKFKEERGPMTFIQYCHYWGCHLVWGNENPILHSNYSEHLDRWKEFDPVILELEDLIKDPDFPRENEATKKTMMSDSDYEYASTLLRQYQEILQGKFTVKAEGKLD